MKRFDKDVLKTFPRRFLETFFQNILIISIICIHKTFYKGFVRGINKTFHQNVL